MCATARVLLQGLHVLFRLTQAEVEDLSMATSSGKPDKYCFETSIPISGGRSLRL